MNNPNDTTGKRWWVNEFLMKFTCQSAHKVAGKHYAVLEATPKEMESFIAKVEDESREKSGRDMMYRMKNVFDACENEIKKEAFRKGVEASLLALPKIKTYPGKPITSTVEYVLLEAKENIGKLLK